FIAFFLIVSYLPENITFTKALDIAGASGKMNILDFSFDFNNRYTFWSGIIGGTFLALSYFGTDQSQVQRYLSGKSVKEMQMGLIFNGLLKVPMQFFILLVGVMVFVFYQFNTSPVNFNPAATNVVMNSSYADDYQSIQKQQDAVFNEKQALMYEFSDSQEATYTKAINDLKSKNKALRTAAKALIHQASAEASTTVEANDKDYLSIHCNLSQLARGLIGLFLAVI